MDGYFVCLFRPAFFSLSVFLVVRKTFPCLSHRYERREKFPVEDGNVWDTRGRRIRSSFQAGHDGRLGACFGQKDYVVLQWQVASVQTGVD